MELENGYRFKKVMVKLMKYKNEMTKAMTFLGKQKNTIFIGQTVKYTGSLMYDTFKYVPDNKKIEFPVCEELQMGISIGMSMNGYIPITCYPRFDFLILACNQLVNHLNALEVMSDKTICPKIIIRVGVGSTYPLHGGEQHTKDHTNAFKLLLPNINIISLLEPYQIFDEFKYAYDRNDKKSTMFVEYGDLYNEK